MRRKGVSDAQRRLVTERAKYRCEYCQSPLDMASAVVTTFHIDHIIPLAEGGTHDESNFCLCCPRCNSYKHDKTEAIDPVTQTLVSLFHPRQHRWREHFRWSEDGTRIIGQTPHGRVTVELLRFNEEKAVRTRMFWVMLGEHPPENNE